MMAHRHERHRGEKGGPSGSSSTAQNGQWQPDKERRYTACLSVTEKLWSVGSQVEASEGGFTLIELLIVIVVLGILAAIVVFSLTGVAGQSKQAACTSDAKSVEIAVDAYEAANSQATPSSS